MKQCLFYSLFNSQTKLNNKVKYYSHKTVKTSLPYTSLLPILNQVLSFLQIFESYCVKQFLSFLTCFFSSLPLPLLINSHILEISEMTTHNWNATSDRKFEAKLPRVAPVSPRGKKRGQKTKQSF